MRYLLWIPIFLLTCKDQSSDRVRTTPLETPSGPESALPFLTKDQSGRLLFSWVETLNDTSVLKYSRWEKGQWSTPQEIASGANWFVNWADFPSVVEGNGQLLAHYLAKSSEGTYSYDIHFVHSPDGLSWEKDFIPHQDSTFTEHGFVTFLPGKDGILAAWLDGRNTLSIDSQGNPGAMTLRSAFVERDGNLSQEYELDNRICDCCQTTSAMTENGPVILYRDRSKDEIRDISIVRNINGKWTAPQRIWADGWKIAGCPVNGPKAVSRGNQLAVAWFTAANNNPQVKVIFSGDGGESFGDAIRIDSGQPLGRVDIAMLDSVNTVVSWIELIEGKASVMAKVLKDKRAGKTYTVGAINPSRGSGFPQMELIDNILYFAWTRIEEDSKTIQLLKLRIDGNH